MARPGEAEINTTARANVASELIRSIERAMLRPSHPRLDRYARPMTCAWCREPMTYVHGHAACLNGSCAMFGVNQAECCGGETAETCPAPTSAIARTPVPYNRHR
jgi:hypothetical protein